MFPAKSTLFRLFSLGALVLTASLALTGCIPGMNTTQPSPTPASQNESMDGDAMMETDTMTESDAMMVEPNTDATTMMESDVMMVEGIQTIEVEGGSFYYAPDEIRVKRGEPVRITLNSVDAMHDFVIDELDVKTPVIQAGETATVEFTPETAGEYTFYCSVGQHRQLGMVGTLIVEE